MTVLYDYVTQQADEISASRGDVLQVVEKNADGWWKVSMGGRTGLFPSMY